MNAGAILSVSGFSYAYGETRAVDNISFEVLKGEIFSFLGPNGAGKTTVINTLITLLPMQEGEVTIAGNNLRTDRTGVRQAIGMVFQQITLDKDMTVRESLEFHADIYRMDRTEKAARIRELLTMVELGEKEGALVSTLSGGMKRRLEIARGLLTRPAILFLDEPTIGLDPQTRQKTWEYLRMVNREGTTIFMTTHYMDEADILSDRIALIDHGRIITTGTPDELKNGLGKDLITIMTTDNQKAESLIRSLPGIDQIQQHTNQITIYTGIDGAEILPDIIRKLDDHAIGIIAINLKKPSMDDVFLHYTGTGLRE